MDPFISEIRIFGFDWAPRGWAKCDGSLLSVQQNPALFALLGKNFGGNGTTTFGLPDLRGRVPVHLGTTARNSLTYVTSTIGTAGGHEGIALTEAQIPAHNHQVTASSSPATLKALPDNVIGAAINKQSSQATHMYAPFDAANHVSLDPGSIGLTGGGLPHQNCQPSMGVNFCIALQGIFPSRN